MNKFSSELQQAVFYCVISNSKGIYLFPSAIMKNTKIRDFSKVIWKLQPLNFELEAMLGNSRL